ncbi:MAG: pyridoxal phosphate-dependent aminotransferase [Roseitalea sp.]|jgi:histidinol-phosphate aminotransferase|nr:pyridoxal phosphate-dependent aminotransferase [Roseitalea sp.]MBO6720580.1 pyridoxal phosphate-dependent aminotransferase [Roseitalea sp.]MBO6743727.1 pyridoxal phosphate-dependent aminotransferase [Roseitalea sp.]
MPPRPNPLVEALPATIPFVAPERSERETGMAFTARLGANEGNFGAAPAAIAAMERAAREAVWKYPDPENWALREALAAHLGVTMDEIVVGPGIDGLLGLIVRVFSRQGDAIVTSLGAYPTFNYHVAGHGRRLVAAPYRDDCEDLDALVAAARAEDAAIVYVSNPDNPMGTWWDAAAVDAFCDAVPERTLIVLDEAYGETAPAGTLPPIDTDRPNLIRLRTFSKAYGLAGLRCGYAFGNTGLIAPFEKVRDHFGVNVMAQAAALAALGDRDWLAGTLGRIAAARAEIARIGSENGLTPLPSATNFVTLDCGRDGDHAMAVLQALMAGGVFVRKPMAPVLDRCIRISVGRPEELAHLAATLPTALAKAREPA